MTQAIGTVQSTVNVTSTLLSEVDGLDKTFKCAKSALDLFAATIAPLSEGFIALGNCFKTCSDLMSPFQLFKTVKSWFERKDKNWANTACLVCGTALTALGIGKFLEKVKLFNMSAAVTQIGNIPVIGMIIQVPMGVLALGVSFFDIIDTSKELLSETILKPNKADENRKISKLKDFEECENQRTKWKYRLVDFYKKQLIEDKLPEALRHIQPPVNLWTTPGSVKFNRGVTEEAEKVMATKAMAAKRDASVEKEKKAVAAKEYTSAAKEYLDYKFKKWTVITDNNRVEVKKSRLSIISNISKIALISLGMIGSYFAIAAFTGTAITMLVLGLVVSSIALGKKIYEISHPKKVVPHEPENVTIFRTTYFSKPVIAGGAPT